MGDVVRLHDPSDYPWATSRIKTLWIKEDVEILPHAQKQMQDRNLDILDIKQIVRYGRVVSHSRPMNLWRYKISGTAVDTRKASCIVEIDGHLIIVTVIAAKKKR